MATPLVWMPFDGSLRNLGVYDAELTNNGATSHDSGKIGKCYNFDGSAYMVSAGESLDIGVRSVCFWAYITNTGNYVVFTDYKSGLAFGVYSSYIPVSCNASISTTYPKSSISLNQWNHFAIVKRDEATIELWVNGNKRTAGSNSDRWSSGITDKLAIGARPNGNDKLNGRLNDFRMYQEALSEKEIKDISKALILHYPLDEDGHWMDSSNRDIVYDCSGYHHDGMYVGNPTNTTDVARYEKSTTLDGTNDGIVVDNLDLDSVINDSFTISVWIKSGAGNTTGDYSSVDPYYESNFGKGLKLLWNGVAGDWHHIALVCNGLSETSTYYDGELRQHSNTPRTVTNFRNSWLIGKNIGTVSGTPFQGKMSDFRIYATAFDIGDIRDLYQVGASIDNKQKMHTYDYVEDTGTLAKIQKSGVVKSTEFSEADLASIYSSGDISAADLIEI